MARATGCSEWRSIPAARDSTRASSSAGPESKKAATQGSPVVRVPVLSKKTRSARARRSKVSPALTRIPDEAARPEAATAARGVAMPMAQGQAMRSTHRAFRIPAPSPPASDHQAKVRRAMRRITGTNRALTRSTRAASGYRPSRASSTMRTMRARVVSGPRRRTSMTSAPSRLSVPADTASPERRWTGMDSPVISASETPASPSRMIPSTGMRSPGRTRTRSPASSSPTGAFSSPMGVMRHASVGMLRASRLRASVVRARVAASRYRPMVMKRRMPQAVSR